MESSVTRARQVFSAHAEVVPVMLLALLPVRRILRARGGSSQNLDPVRSKPSYSPRTRR